MNLGKGWKKALVGCMAAALTVSLVAAGPVDAHGKGKDKEKQLGWERHWGEHPGRGHGKGLEKFKEHKEHWPQALKESGIGILQDAEDHREIHVTAGDQEDKLKVADDAIIFRKGERVDLEALDEGDRLFYLVYQGEVYFIQVIKTDLDDDDSSDDRDEDSEDYSFEAIVAAPANDDSLAVSRDGQTEWHAWSDDALIVREGETVSKADLQVGDHIEVRMEDDEIEAVKVTSEGDAYFGYTGDLLELADDRLTIHKDGEKLTYPMGEEADIYRDGERIEADDLQEGEEIYVVVQNYTVTYIRADEVVHDFAEDGDFYGMTLDQELKLSTISIRQAIDGGTQISVYEVAENPEIIGDPGDLERGQAIELRGSGNLVQVIEIED